MSDITAVPIPPTKRSWLVWLGLGVALAGVTGVALAWSGTAKPVQTASFCKASDFPGKGSLKRLASGVAVQTIKPGKGPGPGPMDFVLIGYKGTLRDGTEFDANPRVPMRIADVVPGFSQGLQAMQTGGSYRLCIPPALGYGAQAAGPIPANSTLFFDIEFHEFKTAAEVQAMQAQMQQMQAQQGGGAMPEGATPPEGRPQR